MSSNFPAVLAHYPPECQSSGARFLGSGGGFSGALFWRLSGAAGELCLRRWPPEHPSEDHLRFIHGVLRHVRQQGFPLAAVPLETRDGATFMRHNGHLWELAPWMPGAADYYDRPSPVRLRAAMVALAEFHVAAASFPHSQAGEAASPGIRARRERLLHLMSTGLAELTQSVRQRADVWPELAQRAYRLFELFPQQADAVRQSLTAAKPLVVPQQPCLRDIRRDHVLFQGEAVTGIIDFGAMRLDNVATDVARLLGNLVRDDPSGWQQGLAAYQSIRPLSAEETELVRAFDQSSVLLAGFNWVEWVFWDRREFENRPAVLERVDALLQRLNP